MTAVVIEEEEGAGQNIVEEGQEEGTDITRKMGTVVKMVNLMEKLIRHSREGEGEDPAREKTGSPGSLSLNVRLMHLIPSKTKLRQCN